MTTNPALDRVSDQPPADPAFDAGGDPIDDFAGGAPSWPTLDGVTGETEHGHVEGPAQRLEQLRGSDLQLHLHRPAAEYPGVWGVTGRVKTLEQEETEGTEGDFFLCCLCFLLFKTRADTANE